MKDIQGCHRLGPAASVVGQGEVREGRVPGGGLEKADIPQIPLGRWQEAGGKRQAVGSRIELCVKTSGFSRNLLSQCYHTKRLPSELSDGLG